MKFMTTVKGDVRVYKFLLSSQGCDNLSKDILKEVNNIEKIMAKLGYVFKEQVTSKITGVTYDVYIREEKL